VHAEEFDDIHLKLVPLGDSAVLMPSDGGLTSQNAKARKTAREWWNLFGHDRVSVTELVT
jgi:hypothetical protein